MSIELQTGPTRRLLLAAALQGLTGNSTDFQMPAHGLLEKAQTIAAWAIQHRNNLAIEAIGSDSSPEERQRLGMPNKLDFAAAAVLSGLLANSKRRQPDPVGFGEQIYSIGVELVEECPPPAGNAQDQVIKYLARVAREEIPPGPLSDDELARFAVASGLITHTMEKNIQEEVVERARLVGRHTRPE